MIANEKTGKVTIDTLSNYRTKLNLLKDQFKAAQTKVEYTKLEAYTYEDIVAAMDETENRKNDPNGSAAGPPVIHWSLLGRNSTPWEYKWHTAIRPGLLKFASVVCAVLSILSFLGVVCSMSGVSNNVSPYFLAIHRPNATGVGIVIFIWVTFGYTVYITTWSLFQIKVSAAMEMILGRTSPEALSFNVRMVARLAAPLAFFYLGWISENGLRTGDWTNNNAPDTAIYFNSTMINGTEFITSYNVSVSAISMPSAFSNFYSIQSIGVVTEIFGTVFPIVLFVVMGLFVINMFNRILVLLKLEAYQFGQPIITEEQLREGKRQLGRHKKNTERKFRRGELRSYLMSVTAKDQEAEGVQGGFCASLLGLFAKKPSTQSVFQEETEKPTIKEPDACGGLVEKKGAFSLGVGGGWKECWAEVRSPGFLHFYKDKKSADLYRFGDPAKSSDSTAVVVDLRTVSEIKVVEKKGGKESTEIDLVLADESVKIKMKNANEVDRWRRLLSEWREFALDYGNLYPMGMNHDVESGMTSNSVNPMLLKSSSSAAPAGNKKATIADLDSIQIADEEEEDESGNRPLMKGGKKSQAHVSLNTPAPAYAEEKPPSLSGWLEKKGTSKMVGGDWSKRYLRVDEKAGTLIYSKSSDPSEKPSGTIDLKFVKDIMAYEKSGKPDSSRFNIDMGDKVYKFRAPSAEEGQRWMDSLNAWRDYFLLAMTS